MMPKWEHEYRRYETLVKSGHAAVNQADKDYEEVIKSARDKGIDIGDRKNLSFLEREALPGKIEALKYMKALVDEGEEFVQEEIINIRKTRVKNIANGVSIGVSLLPFAGAAAIAASPTLQQSLIEKGSEFVQKITSTEVFKKVQDVAVSEIFKVVDKVITPDTIKAVDAIITPDLIKQVQDNITPEMINQIENSITPEMIDSVAEYASKQRKH